MDRVIRYRRLMAVRNPGEAESCLRLRKTFVQYEHEHDNDRDSCGDSTDKPFHEIRLELRWQEERRNEPLETFNWHALRHFAISCWIEAGLPPKAVQTFAGHSSLQVTMDRYGLLFRSDDHRRALDAIADQFGQGHHPTSSPELQLGPRNLPSVGSILDSFVR